MSAGKFTSVAEYKQHL